MSKRLRKSLGSAATSAVLMGIFGLYLGDVGASFWYAIVPLAAVISFSMDYFVWNRDRHTDERERPPVGR